MMRIDLLRGLSAPDAAASTAAAKKTATRASAAPSEPATPLPPSPPGGALRRAAYALLGLLVLGAAGLWLAKPPWLNGIDFEKAAALWNRSESARADSLQRAEAVHLKASRLVEARQTAVIEWLATLEALAADPHQAGAVTFTNATFAASGAFALEGLAPSAEALSALQEGLVLVPGLDLDHSRATERPDRRPVAFSFHFSGRISPVTEGAEETEGAELAEAADTLAETRANTPADTARNPAKEAFRAPDRVVPQAALASHMDSLVRAAAGRGITVAPPRVGPVTRQGALNLHAWRLKMTPGTTPAPVADSALMPPGPRTLFVALRELWELERHRGSPFAVQRIVMTEKDGENTVFLDILALTP